jgi:hypothetical protein
LAAHKYPLTLFEPIPVGDSGGDVAGETWPEGLTS